MDINALAQSLLAIAPSLANVVTVICGFFSFAKYIKNNNKELERKLAESEEKLQKAYDDIAIIKSKLESMEKYLMEEKEKKQ